MNRKIEEEEEGGGGGRKACASYIRKEEGGAVRGATRGQEGIEQEVENNQLGEEKRLRNTCKLSAAEEERRAKCG